MLIADDIWDPDITELPGKIASVVKETTLTEIAAKFKSGTVIDFLIGTISELYDHLLCLRGGQMTQPDKVCCTDNACQLMASFTGYWTVILTFNKN